MSLKHLKICVTGATGQIGYTLLLNLANGSVFGNDTSVTLSLQAIPERMTALEGIKLELEDSPLPLIRDINITDQEAIAFKDIDIALLIGAWPRTENMTRKALLKQNVNIFKSQGMALDKYAKKTCKVLVVGNPANTNCFIASKFAPSIPKENFSALTRLDHNRAKAQVALKLGVCADNVKNVTIWGNHSSTQFPDLRETKVTLNNGNIVNALQEINDDHWMKYEFITCVQKRGAAVIAARKLSSAMSAAKAICDHLKSWFSGTEENDWVSMAVFSDGSYGIDSNLIFSFPVRIDGNKNWTIVKDLEINDWARGLLDATEKELIEERDEALEFTRSFQIFK